MSEESRADRLRKRREQSKQSETSKTSEPSKSDKSTESSETVKDQQVGTYMYLPESQKKQVARIYNVLKAEYEFEFEEEFEKNRHYYPLLIQHGLDGLDDLDAQTIKKRLERL